MPSTRSPAPLTYLSALWAICSVRHGRSGSTCRSAGRGSAAAASTAPPCGPSPVSVRTCVTPHSLEIFDRDAAAAAARMSPGKLRTWLIRRLVRLTPEENQRAVASARERRCVQVTHFPDGTSLLEALLPTPVAAAIDKRLRAVARSAEAPVPRQDTRGRRLDGADTAPQTSLFEAEAGAGPVGGVPVEEPCTRAAGDGRTLDQRAADLCAAWLLEGRRSDGVEIQAKIAVMIPEATLLGDSEAPGISADRSWCLTAQDARQMAAGGGHEWYGARYHPGSGPPADETADGLGPTGDEADLLSIVYRGRFPSERLRDALIFRDGTCQAPGCVVPAERCDVDHQIPHPLGPTSAGNLWMLCRRHHRMKSHGFLTPHLLPSRRRPHSSAVSPSAPETETRSSSPTGSTSTSRENSAS